MGSMHPELAGTTLAPEVIAETTQRIAKARSTLIRHSPFFATLALNMDVHVTNGVPTAATTYTDMYFSPDFVKKLSDPELVFLVAHEVMHPMFHHNSRLKGRDGKLWNVAADAVINQHIKDDEELGGKNIARMPDGGVYLPDIFKQAEGTTEGIYRILEQMKDEQPQGGKGQKGQGKPQQGQGGGQGVPDEAPWDDLLSDPGMTPAEQAEQEQNMNLRVAQAANAAKMAGKLSAGLRRLVGEILEPKVDWRDVLRQFVFKARTDDRSWARPNRRFIHRGMFMPSVSGEQMGEMLVAVDCSGSIGPKELNEFAAEIRAIHEDAGPVKLHIVYFDSEISHHDEYERHDTVDVQPHGDGGTAFSPIFRYAEDHEIDPVCCVVLTDLQCDDFGPAPAYPVLWVTNDSTKAPWGQVIKM
jgi:predicted metal-dependent peptidase